MGHKHQTTSTSHIKRLVDDGVSTQAIAKEFGVGKETVDSWLKSNVAPYWTRCACEALERRRGKSNRKIILCEVSNKAAEIIIAIVKADEGNVHVINK